MRVRKVDLNGEWTFGKGKSNYAVDQDAVTQKIASRLRSFLGDCFFDITHGIDWWNILGSKRPLSIGIEVRQQILDTEGVTKLIELSDVLDEDRNVSLVYSASTVYSVTEPIEDEVEIPSA